MGLKSSTCVCVYNQSCTCSTFYIRVGGGGRWLGGAGWGIDPTFLSELLEVSRVTINIICVSNHPGEIVLMFH